MARHRHLGHAFGGHDPGVCAHIVHSNSQQLTGEARAMRSIARAIALAEMLDHPNSLAHGLHNTGMVISLAPIASHVRGGASRRWSWRKNLACRHGAPAACCLPAGRPRVGSGVADAARVIDAEIDKATAAGPLPQYYLGLAAEVLLAAGRPADGLAHLDRAIAGIDEPGIGFYLPEIYRLRGACLLAQSRSNKEEAASCFATACDIARRQGCGYLSSAGPKQIAKLSILISLRKVG